MAERKSFLLRVDPALLEAMQRWANDDLRSLNAQIEFVLRRTLQHERRLKPGATAVGGQPDADASATTNTTTNTTTNADTDAPG